MKTVKIQFRTSPEEQRVLAAAARARGYSNASAFARAAVRKEISERDELTEAEQRIAASFDRLLSEVTRVSRQQQALFALVDTFAKTFLTCVPEPPADARSQAVALARDRYDQFIKSAGRSLHNGSRASLREVVFADAARG
jgi:hypothetical protein